MLEPSATRSEFLEGEEKTVVIEDFGFTGEGFVRLEDGWLSVPGALPGERVVVRAQPGQSPRARRIYADVVEVVRAADERHDPHCGRYDRCRGCQLRHIHVAGEVAFKVRTVVEVLERYAGVDREAMPEIEVVAPRSLTRVDAFRIRSRLTYRRVGDGYELGLYSPVSEELIPMVDCPALTGPVQRLIGAVEKTLRDGPTLPDKDGAGVVGIAVVAPNYGVGLIDVEVASGECFQGVVDQWAQRLGAVLPDGVGMALRSGQARKIIKGPERIVVPIEARSIEVGYDDWCHAALKPAEAGYDRLVRWLDLQGEERVLDVGCGTGTISVILSERAREVVGLDANRQSVANAEHNALVNDRENVRFVVGGWEKGLRKLLMAGERFDVATINPMREPLGERPLVLLQSLGVKRIVYLGPSPESASRDLGVLLERGFELRRAAAANLHPGTYHTFLMAEVSRGGPV